MDQSRGPPEQKLEVLFLHETRKEDMGFVTSLQFSSGMPAFQKKKIKLYCLKEMSSYTLACDPSICLRPFLHFVGFPVRHISTFLAPGAKAIHHAAIK